MREADGAVDEEVGEAGEGKKPREDCAAGGGFVDEC